MIISKCCEHLHLAAEVIQHLHLGEDHSWYQELLLHIDVAAFLGQGQGHGKEGHSHLPMKRLCTQTTNTLIFPPDVSLLPLLFLRSLLLLLPIVLLPVHHRHVTQVIKMITPHTNWKEEFISYYVDVISLRSSHHSLLQNWTYQLSWIDPPPRPAAYPHIDLPSCHWAAAGQDQQSFLAGPVTAASLAAAWATTSSCWPDSYERQHLVLFQSWVWWQEGGGACRTWGLLEIGTGAASGLVLWEDDYDSSRSCVTSSFSANCLSASPWPLPSSPGHCGHSFSLCSTKMVLGVGSESGARRLDQNKIYLYYLYYYPFNLPYDLWFTIF